jgi:protein-S-isoprenylcysteine O-methyltransferase Ste14
MRREGQTKAARVLPTTYLLGAIVAMIALQVIVPVTRVIPFRWNLIGIIPLVLGVTLNLIADAAFRRGGTTVKPFEESAALITNGVFRMSRNPMYLGFVGMLVGIAVFLRSLAPYGVILVFAILINRVYIRVEERMLAARFGPAWEEYKKNTRRWL